MSIKLSSKLIPFLLLIFITGQFSAIKPAFAADGDVNAIGTITVAAAEEGTFREAFEQIGGTVIGTTLVAEGVLLELLWPDRAGDIASPVLCIGQACVNAGEAKSVSFVAPASYTVKWNVSEQSNVKCYTFDEAMLLNASVSFFESLPTVGPMNYAPNTRWQGYRSGEGGEIAYESQPDGDYWYSLVCFHEQEGGWLTQAIDAINIFGNVERQAYFTKQETLHVTVDSSEPVPEPAPTSLPPQPPEVSLSANPSFIYQGEPVRLGWHTDNATSCNGSDPLWFNSLPVNGSRLVYPNQIGTNTYTLNCSGPGGSASRNVQIEVMSTVSQGCLPQVNINVRL